MKTDLSSQITLTRVPKRFIYPENAFENSVLTRLEKVPTQIYESVEEGSFIVASEIADQIKRKQALGENFVMTLPGGFSPQSLYTELVRMHKEDHLSFSNVIALLEYEFYPLSEGQSGNLDYIKDLLLDHIDIKPENIYAPDGHMPKNEIVTYCKQLEDRIQELGGIDYMILGIGNSSKLMFNGSGTSINSGSHLVLLEGSARKEAARIFQSIENVPAGVIAMGVSSIRKSKQIVLLAWGEDKADVIAKTVEGEITETVPSTFLQQHSNAKLIIDLPAAYQLTRISHPWLVSTCDWDDKLIRRAIVWLCQRTNKPILKLTNKDYSENGLGELSALFGSAYNVNIRIFNDIQHTITGWPGGKPNADDTDRPERAKPFPKEVLVFSPHPDDDVISMGGTLNRLCIQKHNVHVAYETSGNIAVGDEEVIRYCEFLRDVSIATEPNSEIAKKAKDMIQYLRYEKIDDGSPERKDVLFLKGTIRREEARHACRFTGIKDENIHFLDLPFYETGLVKKNPLSVVDKDIVKKLLLKLKPDEMFVAGDLADPHGTHRVCLNAVLAAIDELKDEEWLKNCRIWMYRGAWAEWEMDHVEMAVPISPEELRHKRNAILKHQSQAESAPYLGDDERLFWQRAEDRNRATAELYRQLGLASYEAIEAFVQYIPIR